MIITEKEMVHLMSQSNAYKVIQCSFGVNYIELLDKPENDWAKDIILRLRESVE